MKIWGMILGIIGVILIIIMFTPFTTGVKTARTESKVQLAAVTTGAVATTGNVTLTSDLWNDGIENVSSITSNDATDVPNPESYTAATNILVVNGLEANVTRTLTVTYLTGALADYSGADSFLKFIVTMVAIAIVVILIAIMWGAFKH